MLLRVMNTGETISIEDERYAVQDKIFHRSQIRNEDLELMEEFLGYDVEAVAVIDKRSELFRHSNVHCVMISGSRGECLHYRTEKLMVARFEYINGLISMEEFLENDFDEEILPLSVRGNEKNLYEYLTLDIFNSESLMGYNYSFANEDERLVVVWNYIHKKDYHRMPLLGNSLSNDYISRALYYASRVFAFDSNTRKSLFFYRTVFLIAFGDKEPDYYFNFNGDVYREYSDEIMGRFLEASNPTHKSIINFSKWLLSYEFDGEEFIYLHTVDRKYRNPGVLHGIHGWYLFESTRLKPTMVHTLQLNEEKDMLTIKLRDYETVIKVYIVEDKDYGDSYQYMFRKGDIIFISDSDITFEVLTHGSDPVVMYYNVVGQLSTVMRHFELHNRIVYLSKDGVIIHVNYRQ